MLAIWLDCFEILCLVLLISLLTDTRQLHSQLSFRSLHSKQLYIVFNNECSVCSQQRRYHKLLFAFKNTPQLKYESHNKVCNIRKILPEIYCLSVYLLPFEAINKLIFHFFTTIFKKVMAMNIIFNQKRVILISLLFVNQEY